LARQAVFEGDVVTGAIYLLVDDFIGQGGTLANLKGYIEVKGGRVIGATVLTGKSYSSVLEPTSEQLTALRTKHGQALEDWWQERFGYGFDCLTQSEARYLERSPDADKIRNRITEEEQTGNRGAI
jgi:hypoxanthine-guanine phosphoribosyltransferase